MCLLVTGPGGKLEPHHHLYQHHHHLNELQQQQQHQRGSSGVGSGGVGGGVGVGSLQHHHHQHHQMSYQNMFTPSGDPGTMWRCTSCGKEVTNRWHHYHSHTAQRSMCPYCPATYSRIDTLRSHLRVKHADRLIKH